MYKTIPFTKNRQVIYQMLTRAKKFHLPVSCCLEVDCTVALQRLRELRRQGVPASFSAFLAKATSQLLVDHPHLNTHIFTKWNGRKEIVQFDQISCNLIVQRQTRDGEHILLPLVLKESDKMSIDNIEKEIQFHKTADLETLPQFQSFEKLKKTPSLLLDFFSYKTRSDPDFYLKYFGTYGLSTLYSFKSSGVVGGSTVANTAIAFLPYSIVTNKTESGRKSILKMGIVMDHYVLDGMEMTEAGYQFQKLIESPERILQASNFEASLCN